MAQRLTWDEIKNNYDREWIELIDYDWPEEEENPRSGTVRVHSSDRAVFYQLAAIDAPFDSAIVYVGKQKLPDDQIFSPGARRVVDQHA